jgi:toxin ParE1/3/4
MAEVIWTDPALAQLTAILDYISLDKPPAAEAVAKRIFEATDALESFVRIGRAVPEFKHPDYRQVWLKPCWVYYRIDGQKVVILHVRRSEKPLRVDDLFIGD